MTAKTLFNRLATIAFIVLAIGAAWGFVAMIWSNDLHRMLGFSAAICGAAAFFASLVILGATDDET